MDVKNAFLHGPIDKEVFIELPKIMFEESFRKKNIGVLHKALYGLRQAPKLWNQFLDSKFKELNFDPLNSDPCLYVQ
jgi:Reverse transcriptase (RNA-dependent DNA polymerase)